MRKSILAVTAAALLAIASVGSVSADPGTGKGPSRCKTLTPGADISADAKGEGLGRGGASGYVIWVLECNPNIFI